MTVRLRVAILAGLFAASLGMVGCGAKSGGAPGVTPTAGSVPGTAAAAPVGRIKDACSLVSLPEAVAATGLTGLSKEEGSEHFCSYQGGGAVDVSVTPAPYAKASVDTQKADMNVPSTDIPGLGDAAFIAQEQPGIGVGEIWVKGFDIEIRVKTSTKDPVAAAGSLLRTAVSHLPSA
jgi:hypothetical protein